MPGAKHSCTGGGRPASSRGLASCRPPSASLWLGQRAWGWWQRPPASSCSSRTWLKVEVGRDGQVGVCPQGFQLTLVPSHLTPSFSSQIQMLLTCNPFRSTLDAEQHPLKDVTSSHHGGGPGPYNKSLIHTNLRGPATPTAP